MTGHRADGTEHLIIACADGAGSASHADIGARMACEAAVGLIMEHLDAGRSLSQVNRAIAVGWMVAVRDRLAAEADRLQVELRQLSSTLLISVVGPDRAVFAQIGDGAMVIVTSDADGDIPTPAFWPQNGEYANSTYFVTDSRLEGAALFECRSAVVDAIAVFTDGVQLLALNYAERSAHEPFFGPMFRLLRDAAEPSDLHVSFRQFLNSEAVNDRTDDDKTLVVAVRTADRAV